MPRAAKDPETGLTEKQSAFVLAFLETGNASEAYRRAYGVKKMSDKHIANKASELLGRGDIRGRVASLKAILTQRAIEDAVVDKSYVLSRLKTVADRCLQVAPVLDKKGNPVFVETPDGEEAPAFTFNSMGANRALELLGKEIGLFVERKESGKPGEFAERAAKMSDEELDREAGARLERAVKLGVVKVLPKRGDAGKQRRSA